MTKRIYITKDLVINEEQFYGFHYIKGLSEKYNIIYDPVSPQYVISGCLSGEWAKYDCVRIIFYGENLRADFNVADYAIGFDFMDFGDRYIRVPLFYTFVNPQVYDAYTYVRDDIREGRFKKRKKFASILVSNGGRKRLLFRAMFFRKLSRYKQVDSGGVWENNIGYKVSNKCKWLQDYKFNICFENSSYPGYLTEKLYEAYISGCVPIYWGDTSLRCFGVLESPVLKLDSDLVDREQKPPYNMSQDDDAKPSEMIDTQIPRISQNLFEYRVNPKAFINAHNFENLDALISEVKRLDSDENAFLEMLREELFLDDFKPFEFYEEKIFGFLDSILSQDYANAFRRGNSAQLYQYNNRAKKRYKLATLRSQIVHYPRNLIRRLRGRF